MLILLHIFVAFAVAQEGFQFQEANIVCAPFERRCEVPYCFDPTCDGLLIESSRNGRCPCNLGLIRNRRTRRCEPPAPNCIGQATTPAPGPRTTPGPRTRPPLTLQPTLPPTFPPTTPPPPPPDDHMYTTDYGEITSANKETYVTEEAIGRVAPNPGVINGPCPTLRPFLRFYEYFWANNHFYTTSPSQAEMAVGKGYTPEGTVGHCVTFAPACGADIALHRFWNEGIGDHIYVTKAEDVKTLQDDSSWTYEGIECYIWPTSNAEVMELNALRADIEARIRNGLLPPDTVFPGIPVQG